MFETKNDLFDLHTQVKHAHWNVKGPEFIALHKLFDGIYDAVVETALVRGGTSAIEAVTANPRSAGRRAAGNPRPSRCSST